MGWKALSTGLILLATGLSSAAEPSVKVINFTANWCPLCRVLDPRLTDAVDQSNGQAVLVTVDMTHLTRSGSIEQKALADSLKALTASLQAGYLWDWYGGRAGIAIIIASDNGEPLTCISTALTTAEISDRIQESLVLATIVRPGRRRPDGTDCPPPKR